MMFTNRQTRQTRHTRPGRRFAVPIRWKLLGATAVVGVVAAGIAVVGLTRMQALDQRLTQIVEYTTQRAKLASLLRQDLVTVTRAERNLILARSEDQMHQYAKAIDDTIAAMQDRQARLRGLSDEDDRHQLDLFAAKWKGWLDNHYQVRRFAEMDSESRAQSLSATSAREAMDRLKKALRAVFQKNDRAFENARAGKDVPAMAEAGEKRKTAARLLYDTAQMRKVEKDLILARTEEDVRRSEAEFAPLQRSVASGLSALERLADDAEKAELAQARNAYDDYLKVNSQIRVVAGQRGGYLAYQLTYEVGRPLAAECEILLDAVVEKNEREMQQYRADSQQIYQNARNSLLGFSAVGIAASTVLSFYIGQRIARQLSALAKSARSIQDTGDLSRPIPEEGDDEVGQLAQSLERMRKSLFERSTELAALNQRLAHQKEDMEQFVYTVSHDLKSPLVSCKGLIGLLREDIEEGDSQEVGRSLDRLDQATNQLSRTIDDLLALSRIGRKPLSLHDLDVRALAMTLKEELAQRLEEARAELRVEDGMPRVTTDAGDLKRVLENLLVNAIKYACDRPDPRITVGGRDFGDEVRFFVRDNGPGIEPKYHQRIFGLFQRLDTSKPGSGVGLASAAKIMRLHGGRIWVDSVPGHGATFWLAFPRPGVRKPASRPAPLEAPAVPGRPQTKGNNRP